MTRDIDCGDNSCLFAKNKGGMRTNGGCRCFDHAGFSKDPHRAARQMLPELLELRDRAGGTMRPRNKKYVSKKSTKLSKTECDELIVACVVAEHESVLSKKIHDRLIAKLELIKEEIK